MASVGTESVSLSVSGTAEAPLSPAGAGAGARLSPIAVPASSAASSSASASASASPMASASASAVASPSSPSSPPSAADASEDDADLDEKDVALGDLPDAVRRCRKVEVIRRLAKFMPGLRNALKADKDAEEKASINCKGDVPPPNKSDARRASPPVRGAHSGLQPPTALQWLLQCITGESATLTPARLRAHFPNHLHDLDAVAHYWSVPAEAATFLFSVNGVDWITWLWHALLFSPLRMLHARRVPALPAPR